MIQFILYKVYTDFYVENRMEKAKEGTGRLGRRL